MQTVAETTIFRRRAEALLSEQEHLDLIEFLSSNTYLGDEIVGTGGVRRLRFAARGKGKKTGVRVRKVEVTRVDVRADPPLDNDATSPKCSDDVNWDS